AKQKLTEVGFVVVRVDASNETVGKGRVISQDPSADVQVAKGKTITLTVSTGKELVAVPNVVGQAQDSAKGALQDAGFTVVVKQKTDDKIPAGNVISQDPAAGTKLAKGKTVTLTVSTGPPPV